MEAPTAFAGRRRVELLVRGPASLLAVLAGTMALYVVATALLPSWFYRRLVP
jgi:hypothetical protein